MRCLVVEDEFTSRRILQRLLSEYGECDIAVDGDEALDAYRLALENGEPYDLVSLDIMLPGTQGQEVLTALREMEAQRGIGLGEGARVMMTTSLSDAKNVIRAFRNGCEAYLVKPVDKAKLLDVLGKLGFSIAA